MNVDYFNLDAFLQPEEKALRDTVRRFVDERCAPYIGEWWENESFPKEIAHELGQQRAGRTDQGSGHDQREVAQDEPTGRDRQAGERIQHRDHDRHVRSTNRQHEGNAQDQAEDQQGNEDDRRRGNRDQVDRQRDDGQRQHAVDACSFANATRLPAKDTEPITMLKTLGKAIANAG